MFVGPVQPALLPGSPRIDGFHSLDYLKNLGNNSMIFDGRVPDCDVCATNKSHQLAHPKTADHKVKLPFQLVFADLMGPITPEALGGYKYITNIFDEHTK